MGEDEEESLEDGGRKKLWASSRNMNMESKTDEQADTEKTNQPSRGPTY